MKTSPDESYCLLGAGYVCRQVKQLSAQLDGVRRAEDVECVHQARVASRRLRAALRVFRDCFGRKQVKRWREAIRGITSGLGEARDFDVQIEFLCDVLGRMTERNCYAAVVQLMAKIQRQRERIQPEVVAAVDQFEAAGVLEEMRSVGKQMLAEAEARQVGLQSEAGYRQTEQHILEGLNEVMRYEDSLDDPEDKDQHHAMRIAVKGLRYTVEIAKPVHEDRLDAPIATIKHLQMMLGELHDCDVWIDRLTVHAKQQRKRLRKRFGYSGAFKRLKAGMEFMKEDRRRQRSLVFEQLVSYWRQLAQEGFWEDLIGVIGRPAPQADHLAPVPRLRSEKLTESNSNRGGTIGSPFPTPGRATLTDGRR